MRGSGSAKRRFAVLTTKSIEQGSSMKHKSRLDLVAVLIQALLLFVPVNAFASTEADQEIGIPQPMEMRAKGCFGVVLSPDGDGFYSVRDGLLTHYQIDPFKKTASIIIDEAQLKDIPEKTECRVLIMDDRSKLILVFREWIVVLDRRTGVISKKLKREGALERTILEASALNGNDLVFLGRFPNSSFRLTVVDARTLQFKKQVSDVRAEFGLTGGVPFITKIENRLYLSSGGGLVVLNGKTYEPELALLSRAGEVGGIKISKDYRTLYVANVWSVQDYLTKTEKNSASDLEDSDVVFDQETRQVTYEKNSFSKLTKEGPLRERFDPVLFGRNTSRNRNYVTGSLREYALIKSRNTDNSSFFYQYESAEAILIEALRKGPFRFGNFDLTPGARQYLMMKNRADKLVPINAITFNQYFRTESRR